MPNPEKSRDDACGMSLCSADDERMKCLGATALGLGLVLLVVSSCAQATPRGEVAGEGNSPADAAEVHRAQWEAAGVSDYTWHVYVGCFCDSGTSTVKVVDGQPVELLVDGEPSSIKLDQEHGIIPLTMEDLFDALDDAYTKHAEVVRVTYDQDLGYPSDISIDPNYGCSDPAPDGTYCTVSDDEMRYSVKSFEAN